MKKNKIIDFLFITSLILTIILLPTSLILLYKTQANSLLILPFNILFISFLTFVYLLLVKVNWLLKNKLSFNIKNIFITQQNIRPKVFTKKITIFWFILLFIILLVGTNLMLGCYIEQQPRAEPAEVGIEYYDHNKFLQSFHFKFLVVLGWSLHSSSFILIIASVIFLVLEKRKDETRQEANIPNIS